MGAQSLIVLVVLIILIEEELGCRLYAPNPLASCGHSFEEHMLRFAFYISSFLSRVE